jgi:hypothetical protein
MFNLVRSDYLPSRVTISSPTKKKKKNLRFALLNVLVNSGLIGS